MKELVLECMADIVPVYITFMLRTASGSIPLMLKSMNSSSEPWAASMRISDSRLNGLSTITGILVLWTVRLFLDCMGASEISMAASMRVNRFISVCFFCKYMYFIASKSLYL